MKVSCTITKGSAGKDARSSTLSSSGQFAPRLSHVVRTTSLVKRNAGVFPKTAIQRYVRRSGQCGGGDAGVGVDSRDYREFGVDDWLPARWWAIRRCLAAIRALSIYL